MKSFSQFIKEAVDTLASTEAKNRGLQFAAKMTAADQMELAQRVILTNNGHFLAEAVQTGHGYDAATSYGMKNAAHYYFQIQKNSPIFRDLGELQHMKHLVLITHQLL